MYKTVPIMKEEAKIVSVPAKQNAEVKAITRKPVKMITYDTPILLTKEKHCCDAATD